jgi:hypothetical protein
MSKLPKKECYQEYTKEKNMILPLKEKDLVFDKNSIGPWCKLPYPGHPKGCVNFDKRIGCPPKSEFFQNIITAPFFLAAQKFVIASYSEKIKNKIPNWTDRQASCLKYYQKSVSKKIKEEAKTFIESKKQNLILIERPEANGIDIFNTCKNIGIFLDRNPKKIMWKIMLIGKKINKNQSE